LSRPSRIGSFGGKDNVDSLIWDFINQNHNHLEHNGDYEPNKVYPSRRSWDRLSKVLVASDMLKPGPAMFNLATSFVGFEAAVSLSDFAKNYDRQVTVEQLLKGERKELIAGFSLNDHCALIEKLTAEATCKEPLTEDQLGHLSNWFCGMPSEAAMKLWSVVAKSGCNDNVIGLHKAGASEFLARCLQDQPTK
jgi:hypothetical protein